jgi:histidinol-phosphate aminotransferase
MMRIQGIPDLGPGLRLHLNENTAGCSPKVVEAVRAFDARGLATYPDYRAAVVETAAFLGVNPEWLVLTNGLDEGVLLASLAFLAPAERTPEVVMPMPAFDTYVSSARAMRARVVPVPPGPHYSFPLEGVLAALTAETRLVYINNPNNPSGQPVSKDVIRRIAATAAPAVVFVDEAYHDFLGENFLDEAAGYPNVVIGRTFSKAYGLAGMRVGAMIARPELLEPIRAAMPVFNLNVVAVEALRAALKDNEFKPWYVAQAAESKQRLYAALDRVGLPYWKSAANFVLVDGGARVREMVDRFIGEGVLVRDRSHDPYCPRCFRITAGVVEHTEKAIAVLEDLCAKP